MKHFFLAIYNVSVVGGAMYFFSLYGATSVAAFVLLRCVGIFVSATLPVLIIMIPKFTVIQYKNITGKNLWSSNNGSRSNKNKSNSHSGLPLSEKMDPISFQNSSHFDGKILPVAHLHNQQQSQDRSNQSSASPSPRDKLQMVSQSASASLSAASSLNGFNEEEKAVARKYN